MNGTLPAYPEELGNTNSWQNMDVTEQYAKFDYLITEAEHNSLFDSLPNDPLASRLENYNQRGQVIAERLWLLGYLEASDVDMARAAFKEDRDRVLDAVEKFQEDAGLKIDRWPGVITWKALGNLVSFESDNLDRVWLENPEHYPAVLRAAQCRLYVLGLSRLKPDNNFQEVEFRALRKFKLLALALGVITLRKEQISAFLNSKILDEKTLVLLLDQDRLIAAAARANKKINGKRYFKYTPILTSWSHKAEVRAFLVRLIQIEFWLLGYDIELMSPLNYPIIGFYEGNKVKRSQELKICLEDFARLAGKSRYKWSRELTPGLFIALHKAAEKEDQTDLQKILGDRFKNQEQIDEALNQGRKLHLRLWDGIKRFLRWLGRLFEKTLNTILDLSKNIARFFYNYAQQAFDILKKAVGVIIKAFATLDGSRHENEFSFVDISVDGDVIAGISSSPDLYAGLKLITFLRLDAERFCLAAQLCALILSALIKSSFARWASLAKTLYTNLEICLGILSKIYSLEKEMALMNES